MKLFPILTVLAATSASAAEMKACGSTSMNGKCAVQTNYGKRTGNWKSYNWRSSAETCVKVCNGCTEIGWRCKDYSNNNISFNKFIVFSWDGGEGPDNTSCC